jgi:hypothetical protein
MPPPFLAAADYVIFERRFHADAFARLPSPLLMPIFIDACCCFFVY